MVEGFLGNNRDENYAELVPTLVTNYSKWVAECLLSFTLWMFILKYSRILRVLIQKSTVNAYIRICVILNVVTKVNIIKTWYIWNPKSGSDINYNRKSGKHSFLINLSTYCWFIVFYWFIFRLCNRLIGFYRYRIIALQVTKAKFRLNNNQFYILLWHGKFKKVLY